MIYTTGTPNQAGIDRVLLMPMFHFTLVPKLHNTRTWTNNGIKLKWRNTMYTPVSGKKNYVQNTVD